GDLREGRWSRSQAAGRGRPAGAVPVHDLAGRVRRSAGAIVRAARRAAARRVRHLLLGRRHPDRRPPALGHARHGRSAIAGPADSGAARAGVRGLAAAHVATASAVTQSVTMIWSRTGVCRSVTPDMWQTLLLRRRGGAL